MSLHRRTALRMAGTAGLAALAGCSSVSGVLSTPDRDEYTLHVERVDQPLVEHVTYDVTEGSLFADGARTALDAIVPDGRYTTYGFEPLPADAYVRHDGRYFQTKVAVTGRERMERRLVRAERVAEEQVPDDAPAVGSLPRASGRVVKILHSYHATDGGGSATDLLREDAYVLRRPAELDGPIAGDLDGQVVTMDESGNWAYRISITTETVAEPVYETFAVDVAEDRDAFREVVFATRVDAELTRSGLDSAVRELLERTIERDSHSEETPLDRPFERLLERLGLADVDGGKNGQLLWYDESLFRYGLYVNAAD